METNAEQEMTGTKQATGTGPTIDAFRNFGDAEMRLADALETALQRGWNDFCADTGCFPDCLSVTRSRKGLFVEADFRRSNFVRMATGWLLSAHPEVLSAFATPPAEVPSNA